ncbi:hypothetical protein ACWEFQ_04685, partial [Streptomyces albogriseolus]
RQVDTGQMIAAMRGGLAAFPDLHLDVIHVLRTLTTAARSHGITVVLATHDAQTAALADRTVSLLDGRCVRTVHLPPVSGPAESEGRAACSLSV